MTGKAVDAFESIAPRLIGVLLVVFLVIGQVMLLVVVVLIAIGSWVIRKIVTIEV